MLLLMLLLFSERQMTITQIEKVVQPKEAALSVPSKLLRANGRIYLLDGAAKLWVISDQGEITLAFDGANDPRAQLRPPLRNLYASKNGLTLLHEGGRSGELMDADGQWQKRAFHGVETMMRWDTQDFQLRGAHDRDAASVTLSWTHPNGSEELPLMVADQNDRCPWRYFLSAEHNGYVLIYNLLSVQRTLYYAVLNTTDHSIWDLGQKPLADPAPYPDGMLEATLARQNGSLPVVVGVTTSDQMGFIITENIMPARNRYLRRYQPKEQTWEILVVDQAQTGDMTHYQHLNNNRWMAVRGKDLVFFTMK